MPRNEILHLHIGHQGGHAFRKVATEFKMDLKLLPASRRVETEYEDNDAAPLSRREMQRLQQGMCSQILRSGPGTTGDSRGYSDRVGV
jgi:hypothetical protein